MNGFRLFYCNSFVFSSGYALNPPLNCIKFSSGGIFFWWQAGAAKYVQATFNLKDVAVIGSSAGAISATLLKTGSCFDLAAQKAITLATENDIWSSPTGLAGIWGSMVEEWLHTLLPDELTDEVRNNIHIAATPLNLLRSPVILSQFKDKTSLIRANMVSAHIPFFMNGKLWTSYNNQAYIDGSFWSIAPGSLKREAWPHHIDRKKVLQINWQHDEEFCMRHKKTKIVSLLTPDGLYDMMDSGYNYMKKLDSKNQVQLSRLGKI